MIIEIFHDLCFYYFAIDYKELIVAPSCVDGLLIYRSGLNKY
jgi:hypothetical protein